MSSTVGERVRFLRSFLAHPRQVGALLPTSARAVRDMLDLADLGQARLVVELGAGTGVHTQEILARLGPDARLIAFEIDQVLVAGLEARLPDSRLQVVADSAEKVEDYVSGDRADVVVSAIPYTSLPGSVRAGILDRAQEVLAPGGTMLVLQYSPLLRAELRRRFGSVRTRVSWLNVPPAFLFRCTATAARDGSAPAESTG